MELVTTLSLRRPTAEVIEAYELPCPAGYELGRYLGGGGMGVVFEARQVVLDRRVALKFVRPEFRDSPEARRRLVREAQVMARVTHPNVVTLFELGVAGDDVFLAMELVPGGTLREWLHEPRAWREIVDVFLALGCALA